MDAELAGHIIRAIIMVTVFIWAIWPMVKAAMKGELPWQ